MLSKNRRPFFGRDGKYLLVALVAILAGARLSASLGESGEQLTTKWGEQQRVHPQYSNPSMAVDWLGKALYFGLPDGAKGINELVKALNWEDADLRGYVVGSFRVSAILIDDKSAFETYWRGGTMSDKEIQALLSANSGGATWEKVVLGDGGDSSIIRRWKITDRKTNKPVRFAVLNGGSTFAFFSSDILNYLVRSGQNLVSAEQKKRDDELDTLTGPIHKRPDAPVEAPARESAPPPAPDATSGGRLDPSNVADWNLGRVQRAIDEIYARHGMEFSSYEKQAWAESQSWYHRMPGLKPDAVESSFTDDEKSNVEVLAARRAALRSVGSNQSVPLYTVEGAPSPAPATARRAPEKTWDRPHVYIQLADESQRKTAIALKQRLAKSGFVVEGIENSKGHPHVPKGASELDYFAAGDAPEATRIAKDLSSVFTPAGIQAVVPEGTSYVSHARQYEIWFSPTVQ